MLIFGIMYLVLALHPLLPKFFENSFPASLFAVHMPQIVFIYFLFALNSSMAISQLTDVVSLSTFHFRVYSDFFAGSNGIKLEPTGLGEKAAWACSLSTYSAAIWAGLPSDCMLSRQLERL